jgi:hypothetical protein
MPPTPAARATAALLALITWAALALQLYLVVTKGLEQGEALTLILTNYFSFFTILSNLLVAIILSRTALTPDSPTPGVQAATAVYIAVVGLGYSLLLRHIWDPQGLQKLADVLLHDAMPLLYVLFWLVFCRRRKALPWNAALVWLIWPVIYLVCSMVRGSRTGQYSYHFLDPSQFGSTHVFITIVGFLLAFLALGLAVVALTRRTPPDTLSDTLQR